MRSAAVSRGPRSPCRADVLTTPIPSTTQLALPLRLPAPEGFERFVPGDNLEAIAALQDWCRLKGSWSLFLHGGAGSGKSHLLQSAAARIAELGRRVLYLSLDSADLTPMVLDDLEQLDAVLLDTLEAVAGQRQWEEAIFHLYNRLQQTDEGRLLVAARLPPGHLELELADLRSRLSASPAYLLKRLDDAGRARLLRQGAEHRGLQLSDAVVSYMLTRCPRDPAWLTRFLDQLDEATLAEQRAPTVPFIGKLLDGLPPAQDGDLVEPAQQSVR